MRRPSRTDHRPLALLVAGLVVTSVVLLAITLVSTRSKPRPSSPPAQGVPVLGPRSTAEAAVQRYAEWRPGGIKVEHVMCHPTGMTFTCLAVADKGCDVYEARHRLSGKIVVRELEGAGCAAKTGHCLARAS